MFTGQIPFYEFSNDYTVTLKVVQGLRPTRPGIYQAPELATEIWGIMQECWCQSPNRRPSVVQLIETLSRTPTTTRQGDLQLHLQRNQEGGINAPHLTPLSFRTAMRGKDTYFSEPDILLMRECITPTLVPESHREPKQFVPSHNKPRLRTRDSIPELRNPKRQSIQSDRTGEFSLSERCSWHF